MQTFDCRVCLLFSFKQCCSLTKARYAEWSLFPARIVLQQKALWPISLIRCHPSSLFLDTSAGKTLVLFPFLHPCPCRNQPASVLRDHCEGRSLKISYLLKKPVPVSQLHISTLQKQTLVLLCRKRAAVECYRAFQLLLNNWTCLLWKGTICHPGACWFVGLYGAGMPTGEGRAELVGVIKRVILFIKTIKPATGPVLLCAW